MGVLFSRFHGTKSKRSKRKHQELDQPKGSPENVRYHTQNDSNQYASDRNIANGHENWDKQMDHQQTSNYNVDPPGAPGTFADSYPMIPNDIMNQSWSSHHDISNQYYSMNPLSMPASKLSYDPNQYMHNQVVNTSMNQSQQTSFEERSSKKVQFARPNQQAPSTKLPLSGTQSWHEPSVTTSDPSILVPRQDSSLIRQSVHRSVVPTSNNSSFQAAPEKPIYVGIDHRATLAERGQRTTNKRQHINDNKTSSDTSSSNTNNHRTRSHTHNQHKYQESNDSSITRTNIPVNKPTEPLQARLSNTHRTPIATSTSMRPTNINDPTTSNDIETKQSRKRQTRQSQHPQVELQSLVDNEIKPSKQRENHSHQQKQTSHQSVNRNNSPLRSDSTRRVETRQESTSIMRTSLSPQSRHTQRQKQTSSMPPIAANSINSTRSRV